MTNKILLIDDDILVNKTVRILLSRQGYEVDTAANAIEALTHAATKDYCLVISDIRMPGDSGVIAIQKIKEIYASRKHTCGYIFISGYAEEDTPAHAIRLGVGKFIDKPFENTSLLKAITEEIELVFAQRRLSEQTTQATPGTKRETPERDPRRRRAVITGIGVISPSGVGKNAYWQGLRDGRNCVDKITFFDTATYPSKMAAEIKDFDPKVFIPEYTEIKRMSRSSHLAVAAAQLALSDAGIEAKSYPNLSVLIGSATSGIEYMVPEIRAMERGGIRRIKPYLGIAGFGGSLSSEISRAVGAHAASHTISTGCTSSTDAMGYALRQIQHGLADIILTGGADACVNEGILGASCQMGAVSFRNDKNASRPFNKDRDGFVIAEGSWIFVLEEMSHAITRKAKIYGELIGYGTTCDAWHMAKPHSSGEYTVQAIQQALHDAQMQPEQVNIFEAYGNATPVNDSYETAVVKKVFGQHAYQLAVPSVKSMLGHPIGAAGGQQLAAVLLALNEGFIHPTINYDTPDPECDLDYVPNEGRVGEFNVAICNSLAFGGKNAAIAVRKFKN